MENREYLSEEQYQINNAKVKRMGKTFLIIGIITLAIGILLIISGISGLGNTVSSGVGSNSFETTARGAIGNFGAFALGGFINVIGFGLTSVGGIMMFIAHRREITAYTVQQTMPIAKEGIEKMAPTIGTAAGEIAKGITKGINEARK